MHVVFTVIRAIGNFIDRSGLADMLIKAGWDGKSTKVSIRLY